MTESKIPLTVKALINILKEMPQDLPVIVWNDGGGGYDNAHCWETKVVKASDIRWGEYLPHDESLITSEEKALLEKENRIIPAICIAEYAE